MTRDAKPMMLLPPAPGRCPVCAGDHLPDEPHNQQSLYYQMRFHAEHGRWPRWRDAVAHCDAETRDLWEAELRRVGAWEAPPDDA